MSSLKQRLVRLAYHKPEFRKPVMDLLQRIGALGGKFASDGKKRMVIMVGPPASGKGYFLEGETGEVGKGLPKSTKGLFTDDQIPEEKRGVEESDNDLRAIQYYESLKHFKDLKEAHKKGEKAFKKTLKDKWYKTKDGEKRKMSSFISYDKFNSDDHAKFYGKQAKAFYKNMRGWHNDVDETNPDTGKIKERFKDLARDHFEKDVRDKLNAGKKDMLIVDSAGEDIDAQDFEGQIAAAKNAGYEVTVIALEPEKDDTELSNMKRGFVDGKRMVDQQDIDNYYKKYEKQIEKIKKAVPHNFLQYKKPPISNKKRKRLKKLMTETPDGQPTFIADSSSDIRTVKDLPEDQQKKIKGEIVKTLYANDYEIDKSGSFGLTMEGLPENPHFEKSESTKDKSVGKEKDDSKGSKDKEWLEKKVKNPKTDNEVKIKTLKSKPKDSEEYAFYEKLRDDRKKQKAASAVASRVLLVKRVASKYIGE